MQNRRVGRWDSSVLLPWKIDANVLVCTHKMILSIEYFLYRFIDPPLHAGGYDGFWDVRAWSGHEPGITEAIHQMLQSGQEGKSSPVPVPSAMFLHTSAK